jgi:glycosyltransferase involved in cell wall biosynthesis
VKRILNIVNSLDTGAVENWLVRACEAVAAKNPDWKWTFYCTYGQRGRLDDRASQFGAQVVYSPHPVGNKRSFFLSLRAFLRSHHHDILHCHHDIMSAAYLWSAVGIPFRRRIVHVHNNQAELPTPSRWKRLLLREPMRQTCLRFADRVVGVSQHTLAAFLKNEAPQPPRDRVLYCGIDAQRFRVETDPAAFRREMGLSASARILLFAGRMVPLKNPLFVVNMMKTLAHLDASIVACFVGTGELEEKVARLAQEMSISGRIRLLGWRDDLARIMKASNLLVFPNIEEVKEGLGLVVVEAQAAGLPMLVSQGVSEEAIVVPGLSQILQLATGPQHWARRAMKTLAMPIPDRRASLSQIENSAFSIGNSSAGLMALYEN